MAFSAHDIDGLVDFDIEFSHQSLELSHSFDFGFGRVDAVTRVVLELSDPSDEPVFQIAAHLVSTLMFAAN